MEKNEKALEAKIEGDTQAFRIFLEAIEPILIFFDKTRNSDFLCKVNFSLRMSVRVQNFVVTSGLSKCSMRVPIYRPREIKFEI